MTQFKYSHKQKGVVEITPLVDEGAPAPDINLVHRYHVDRWDRWSDIPGIYVLVAPDMDEDGKTCVYVGKSMENGVGNRVQTHDSSPPKGLSRWSFAVLVIGQNIDPQKLEYKEVGVLERMMYDALVKGDGVRLINEKQPKEQELRHSVLKKLEGYRDLICEILRLHGCYEDGSAKQKKLAAARKPKAAKEGGNGSGDGGGNGEVPPETGQPETKTRKRKHIGVKMADLVTAGLLPLGTRLTVSSTYKQRYPGEAEVADQQGQIRLLTFGPDSNRRPIPADGGGPFKRPSTAAKALANQFGVPLESV